MFPRCRRAAWSQVHHLIPCTTRKLCSDSPLRKREHKTDRRSLPTPAHSASELFCCTRRAEQPWKQVIKGGCRGGCSFGLLVPCWRLINNFSSNHGQQHFSIRNLIRLDFKKVLREHN